MARRAEQAGVDPGKDEALDDHGRQPNRDDDIRPVDLQRVVVRLEC